MFNVTILKLKDIIKYIICIFILILIIMMITNYFSNFKENMNNVKQNIENTTKNMTDNSLLGCLDVTMPVVSSINEEYRKVSEEEDVEYEKDKNFLHEMLQTQISSIDVISKDSENESETTNQEEVNTQDTNSSIAEAGTKTEVITNNPIKETYNVEFGNVKIKNQTDYQLTEEMLNPDVTIENKNIMIFHTHSCESYTSSELYQYTPTGNFRTTDLNYTVTKVGTELTTQLQQYGFNVIHDTSYHDYPSYNGSYTNSLKTVENLLKTNPSDIIIDLHRDAIGSRSDYAPTVKIGDEEAAQIMFVIGTNNGGLWHPNWNQNLKFAIKVQQKANEMYPGLFKPIMLTTSRYNQHTGKYANIIEVGSTGNKLEQCLTSMKYFAKVLDEVINVME